MRPHAQPASAGASYEGVAVGEKKACARLFPHDASQNPPEHASDLPLVADLESGQDGGDADGKNRLLASSMPPIVDPGQDGRQRARGDEEGDLLPPAGPLQEDGPPAGETAGEDAEPRVPHLRRDRLRGEQLRSDAGPGQADGVVEQRDEGGEEGRRPRGRPEDVDGRPDLQGADAREELQRHVELHRELPAPPEPRRGVDLAALARPAVVQLARDGDGLDRVGVVLGQAQFSTEPRQERRLPGVFSVDELAPAGAAKGLDETAVDFRRLGDPVIVCPRQAFRSVEPGPHDDGRGAGEDQRVGHLDGEVRQTRAAMFGVPRARPSPCPGADGRHIDGAAEGEQGEVDGLAGVVGVVGRRRQTVLVGRVEIVRVDGRGAPRLSPFAHPRLVVVEEAKGQPRRQEGAEELDPADEARAEPHLPLRDGGEEPLEEGEHETGEGRRAADDEPPGGREPVDLRGRLEDRVELGQVLLQSGIASPQRPHKAKESRARDGEISQGVSSKGGFDGGEINAFSRVHLSVSATGLVGFTQGLSAAGFYACNDEYRWNVKGVDTQRRSLSRWGQNGKPRQCQ